MLLREIVSALVGSDHHLQPRVRRAVLDRGASIVPILCRLLDEAPERESRRRTGWGAVHALRLLAELRAIDAIPTLVGLLARAAALEIRYSEAIAALKAIGEPAAEPLLAAPRGSEDFEWARDEVLAQIATRDPRVLTRLLAGLEREPLLYATFLATRADPDSLPALSAALDRLPVSGDADTGDILEELFEAIRRSGGSPNAQQERKAMAILALLRDQNRRLREENARLDGASEAIEGYFRGGSRD